MKRALVTGASGFVGRHTLKPLLARGFEVHAVSSRHAAQNPRTAKDLTPTSDVTWHRANLLEPQQQKELLETVQPTHLLHLAWYVTPGKFWSAAENLSWTAASIQLLQQFSQLGGQRLVSAGTCAEYDWNHPLLDEQTTPLNPATLYGSCKNALRSIQEGWSRQTGLSAAWGRVFFVFGPAEPAERLVASVIRSLLLGEPAATSEGSQLRDFLATTELGSAFAALLDSTFEGSANLASGRSLRIREVVESIGEIVGRPELLEIGALPSRPGEPPELSACVSRLQSQIGWRPATTIEQGLAETVDWWRRHLAPTEIR